MQKISTAANFNFKGFSYKMICNCEFFILLSLAFLGLVKLNLNMNSQSNANVIIPNHKTININGLRVYSVAIVQMAKYWLMLVKVVKSCFGIFLQEKLEHL